MALTDPRLMPLLPSRPWPARFTRLLSLLAALLVACLAGCGKPPMLVNQYTGKGARKAMKTGGNSV